jgi:Tfp pilus assembly protein PilP
MQGGSSVWYVRGSMWRLLSKAVALLALAAWIGPLTTSAMSSDEKVGVSESATSLSTGTKAADESPPYDSTGKRDPFRPYVESHGQPSPTGEITPLQQYELSQLRLVAIITDKGDSSGSRAVVEDSAGLGYILRVGTPIGRASGRVTAIERDRVVVEQWPSNVFGEQERTVIVKELDAGEEAKQ